MRLVGWSPAKFQIAKPSAVCAVRRRTEVGRRLLGQVRRRLQQQVIVFPLGLHDAQSRTSGNVDGF